VRENEKSGEVSEFFSFMGGLCKRLEEEGTF
jgi:hypothetical protein